MRIVIAGGSGFLGTALVARLRHEGHDVTVLTREAKRTGDVRWEPRDTRAEWWSSVDGADAVVNLAGAPIDGGRWNAATKAGILDSRVRATRALVAAITGAAAPPAVFLSGSAVGYYGPCGDERLSEEAPAGSDFLASVCATWEREAAGVPPSTRLVRLRTGLVLDARGGALARMLPPFRLGLGGPLGHGRQYWPWIHRADWVEMTRWALLTPEVNGPLNVTAPEPAMNHDFVRALGRALHRPAVLPVPAVVLRLLLGEMADALILSGQRAVPALATSLGFEFRHPVLGQALTDILSA